MVSPFYDVMRAFLNSNKVLMRFVLSMLCAEHQYCTLILPLKKHQDVFLQIRLKNGLAYVSLGVDLSL